MRLDFPAIKRNVIEVYERWAQWQKPILLIEDAGSGKNLVQELYDCDIPAIAIRPEGDKMMRMSAQTAKIEAGAVHLPHHAPRLDDLKSELLAFPVGLRLSTLEPLRALRARTLDRARARRAVGEGVRSCPRAGCGRAQTRSFGTVQSPLACVGLPLNLFDAMGVVVRTPFS